MYILYIHILYIYIYTHILYYWYRTRSRATLDTPRPIEARRQPWTTSRENRLGAVIDYSVVNYAVRKLWWALQYIHASQHRSARPRVLGGVLKLCLFYSNNQQT